MITLKYRRLSWYGVALIPGAGEPGERGVKLGGEKKGAESDFARKGAGGAIRGVARQLCRRARGKRLAARTRLTQKALGLLHDASGEKAGVGHVWGEEGVESSAQQNRRGRVSTTGPHARGVLMGHTRGRAPRCGSPVASLSEGTARTKGAVSAGEYLVNIV